MSILHLLNSALRPQHSTTLLSHPGRQPSKTKQTSCQEAPRDDGFGSHRAFNIASTVSCVDLSAEFNARCHGPPDVAGGAPFHRLHEALGAQRRDLCMDAPNVTFFCSMSYGCDKRGGFSETLQAKIYTGSILPASSKTTDSSTPQLGPNQKGDKLFQRVGSISGGQPGR